MLRNDSKEFQAAVEAVARQIVTAEHRDGTSYIQTPLLYPSGSTVVVRINDAYPNFFITDFGSGYSESEMMGASAIFARNARGVAESYGVQFDEHAFFVMEATREQLAGAVVTVANCSYQAVALAAFKLAERRQADDTEALYRRLVTVFPKRKVAKDAEVMGRSTTKWSVATIVMGDGHPTIFEPVANHHSSIFAASTKFHDIAAAENAPGRVAVVRSKADLKTYLAVLSATANVIERGVPDTTIQRLAA